MIQKGMCHMQRLPFSPHQHIGLRGTSGKGKWAASTLLGNFWQCDLHEVYQRGATMVCDHLRHFCMRLVVAMEVKESPTAQLDHWSEDRSVIWVKCSCPVEGQLVKAFRSAVCASRDQLHHIF